jgi:hypothetical protein
MSLAARITTADDCSAPDEESHASRPPFSPRPISDAPRDARCEVEHLYGPSPRDHGPRQSVAEPSSGWSIPCLIS